MYREFKGLNLPDIDKEILQFWEDNDIFKKSVQERDANNSFVFYEGPPSANGLPGIHHVMARTIKDIFCRFQTLNGKRVDRKGGWDTHGLPIELSVEKELGITKEDIGTKISVDDYNHKCRETVMRFKDQWDDITIKSGYWVDLENPYITFENDYIETVWYLLKRLYDKRTNNGESYLYKGFTIQPYSPAAGTGLSSHELNMPGTYKEVTDFSVIAMFKVKKEEKSAFLFDSDKEDVRIMAWTTTPWTLPSNVALTVGANITYVKVKTFNPYTGDKVSVILAKERLEAYFPKENDALPFADFKVGDKKIPFNVDMANISGQSLVDVRYEQLLPYVTNPELEKDGFRVIAGDFVTTEDGTGVVHTAPYFGADDFKAAKQAGVPFIGVKDDKGIIQPLVDLKGRFVKEVSDFAGKYVKAEYYSEEEQRQADFKPTDLLIALKLKEDGKAFRVEKYKHNYPHCWRTDKPILYYPLDSWFIRASAAKERLVALNKTINWKPEHTGTGRFGVWLENLQDWNLSRSRYWGIPLPLWKTEDGSELRCIGSLPELHEAMQEANKALGLNQEPLKDIHRPYIDNVILLSPSGKPMRRELDLIDVWFDSGAMPYAQWGLDYEKLAAGHDRPFKAPFDLSYPADFIAEGVDQTRGWFYTLHAIAGMIYDSVAFKNVVSNGLVLDKNGQKMSKRLGNAVDPFMTIAKYGADATRWYMIGNAQPWDNLKFDLDGILEVRNKFLGTLYNTYSFFAIYANVDQFVIDENNITAIAQRSELDRWIISKLNSLIAEVTANYEDYEPTLAVRALEKFVDDHLSNWFVRLSRRRFWRGEMTIDKKAAYETLYECLMVCAQLMSPVAPFFAEWLYKNLSDGIRTKAIANNTSLRFESVHLSFLTKAEKDLIDTDLEQRMDYAQRISSLILSLRKKERIRVRQPLQKVLLPVLDVNFQAQVEAIKELVMAETNIKELQYVTDTSGLINKRIRPNLKTLGKLLGKNMKEATVLIEAMTQEDIANLEKSNNFVLNVGGENYNLSVDDFLITSEDIPGWQVANDGALTVALDTTLTPHLLAEGTARELVNRIQNIRKTRDFNLTDKINVVLENHEAIRPAIEAFKDYICAETLAVDLLLKNEVDAEKVELFEDVAIGIQVALN